MHAFRPANTDDHDPLRRIHHAAFHDTVAQQWGWDDDVQDTMWNDYLAEVESLQVIEVDGVVAGYLDVNRQPDHIFIANIALDPSVQGKGVGTLILRNILEEGAKAGIPVRLDVIKANTQARSLYERLGFVWIGDSESHHTMEYRVE